MTNSLNISTVLVFGDTGSGKTTSLATLLRCGSVCVFDTDQQAGKIAMAAKQWGIDAGGLTVLEYNPAKKGEYQRLRNDLTDYARGKDRDGAPRQADFVVWDSPTSSHDMSMTESREMTGQRNPGEIDRETYKHATDHLQLLFQRFMAIPAIRIILAHPRPVKNKDGDTVKIEPALPGQMTISLPRRCGAIFWAQATLREGKVTYSFSTQPSSLRIVRAPYPGFPEKISQDWANVFDLKGRTRSETKTQQNPTCENKYAPLSKQIELWSVQPLVERYLHARRLC